MANKKSKKSAKTSTKPTQKSRGLGDTVEKVTKATGIKTVVKWLAGEDCGCDERKEKLNKMFPYFKPECMTENEYEIFTDLKDKQVVRPHEQLELNRMYNRIFHQNAEATSCGSCLKERIDKLKSVYDTYTGE